MRELFWGSPTGISPLGGFYLKPVEHELAVIRPEAKVNRETGCWASVTKFFDQGNRLATVFRFADYLKIFFQLQQHSKPLAHEPMVIRQ